MDKEKILLAAKRGVTILMWLLVVVCIVASLFIDITASYVGAVIILLVGLCLEIQGFLEFGLFKAGAKGQGGLKVRDVLPMCMAFLVGTIIIVVGINWLSLLLNLSMG